MFISHGHGRSRGCGRGCGLGCGRGHGLGLGLGDIGKNICFEYKYVKIFEHSWGFGSCLGAGDFVEALLPS